MELVRKFFAPEGDFGGYGYAEDEVKLSPFSFGLNAGLAKLVKFEWIPNGGAGGAEQEALDIVFNINGTDKSYRMFPVTKVFNKTGGEIADTTSKEYQDARVEATKDFSATITHILHAFRESDEIKAAMARGFKSFKEYVQFAASLLPTNFKDVPLDIFLQYQWQPSTGQTRTYLEIPKKMKYGPWLKPAMPGTWEEHRKENPTEADRKALWYTNEKGEEHPFVKNGWFMSSNFAKMQGESSGGSSEQSNAMNSGGQVSAQQATTSTTPPAASAW